MTTAQLGTGQSLHFINATKPYPDFQQRFNKIPQKRCKKQPIHQTS